MARHPVRVRLRRTRRQESRFDGRADVVVDRGILLRPSPRDLRPPLSLHGRVAPGRDEGIAPVRGSVHPTVRGRDGPSRRSRGDGAAGRFGHRPDGPRVRDRGVQSHGGRVRDIPDDAGRRTGPAGRIDAAGAVHQGRVRRGVGRRPGRPGAPHRRRRKHREFYGGDQRVGAQAQDERCEEEGSGRRRRGRQRQRRGRGDEGSDSEGQARGFVLFRIGGGFEGRR
mmetsp:Transcript_40000/g.120553  ORF Transcript_40000/g.120553 Transcript_40000/m.120553 type:complete len:225 (+) Transcript_40000:370-1044(+)